jgi:hypothetical protein
MTKPFKTRVKVWIYPGEAVYPVVNPSGFTTGAWHFATIPAKLSKTLDNLYGDTKRGFGSLKVQVTVGQTTWKTSIFPDKKTGTYLLPIKSQVRKAESIVAGKTITLLFQIIV